MTFREITPVRPTSDDIEVDKHIGLNLMQMAEKYNVSVGTIRTWMREDKPNKVNRTTLKKMIASNQYNTEQLASHFGVQVVTIETILKMEGLDVLGERNRPTTKNPPSRIGRRPAVFQPYDVDKIIRLYTVDKLTVDDIATETGISAASVRSVLKREGRWGEPTVGRAGFMPSYAVLFRLYVREKCNKSRIAEIFKTSPITVLKWMREQGLDDLPASSEASPADADRIRQSYHLSNKDPILVADSLHLSVEMVCQVLVEAGMYI